MNMTLSYICMLLSSQISWNLFLRKTLASETLLESIVPLLMQVWKLREKQFIWETCEDSENEDLEPEYAESGYSI